MTRLFLAAISMLFSATMALAADVEARFQSGALSFSGGTGFTNATLEILGPGDFEATETASRGLPVFRVRGGQMKDGFYTFTLTAATDEKVKIKKEVNNGRGDTGRDFTLKPFHMTGLFEVSRGLIVPPEKSDPLKADRDEVVD